MYIPLVEPDQLPESLRPHWERATPAGKRFLGVMANAPAHAERLFAYYNAVRYETRLGIKISELVRLAIAEDTRCEV